MANKDMPIGLARQYNQGVLGTRKLAPVNLRKESYQFVIDGFLVSEVLNQLPENIKIIGAKVDCMTLVKNTAQVVPNKLKKLGVQSIRHTSQRTEVFLVFDVITKRALLKNVKEACRVLGIATDRAFFRYITLSNGTAHGRFEFTTKEIRPNEADLRKKLKVMGLKTAEGRIQGLISELGAKKYKCEIKEETVRLMMCSQA